MPFIRRSLVLSLGVFLLALSIPALAEEPCSRNITANVVAIDAPFFLNRLGAQLPEGMVFALERDVVKNTTCKAGQWCPRAFLRADKRPRPIVLRANIGDCLTINFTNLLSDVPRAGSGQPATRYTSFHVAGMQLVSSIRDDASYTGVNPSSIVPTGKDPNVVAPEQKITYKLRATAEGTFLINSMGAAWGGQDFPVDGAQQTAGLFGAINVEPKGAVWLRSQVTHDEMKSATNSLSPDGQPFLNFGAPELQMLVNNEIVATDLTAIIAGPKENGYKFLDDGDPNTSPVPYEPDRNRPFREFTIEYHEINDSQQAFPIFDYKNATLTSTLQAGGDAFGINYGSGGIGAEILANRFGVGPMNSCADCLYEEFFLSSWTVGDPAMIVDYPANAKCSDPAKNTKNDDNIINPAQPAAPCTPGVIGNAPAGANPQRKATFAKYPSDPSNVYHSYINDRVVFRTLHAGTGVSHVHHLHAHQWFHSPNAEGSTYLDSQLINPGSAYTMEIAHLGSGNLNKVVGDSIFHCHFYPHFAAGMWAHWRSHDVFENGTELDANGKPKSGWNRAQPDGEIALGTPIPALVPMPGLAMAPMPARVQIVEVKDPNNPAGPVVGYRTEVNAADLKKGLNPGFPFFIPGVAGSRAPHPPLDFAQEKTKDKSGNIVEKELNGGLPRHIIINAQIHKEAHNYVDFEKELTYINAYRLPEKGTPEELAAMHYHEQCTHNTFNSLGGAALYRTNGKPPVSGAPYADPGVDSPSDGDICTPVKKWIDYKAAVVQTNFVLNKVGWHYPQSRLLTLWEDVLPTVKGEKPPEPFFIRDNAGTGVNYWHTNLAPNYYDLDDYQVRTPTDIIGQHIHLVKFDVTSSDGAGNGFNYEDGTLSYQEVQDRIKGINQCGGLAWLGLDSLKKCDTAKADRKTLKAEAPPKLICPNPNTKPCSDWFGAQTTVQRWYADDISKGGGEGGGQRTLRTVFTHDHFGPSTHQQVGLYAALLVEPTDSKWYLNDPAKTPMQTRKDGGPTSWEAVVETKASDLNTYREFSIALQDFQFAYLPSSISKPQTFHGVQTEKDGSTTNVTVENTWVDSSNVIEPPLAAGAATVPGPQLVSAGPTSGTYSFNYRNEPLPFRVADAGSFSGGANATDLGHVFASNITRNNPQMNSQPPLGAPIGTSGFRFPDKALTPGMEAGDPYTPLLRTYEGDRVQVRIITGAHMLPHDFTIHGVKWLFEPSFPNSGYRANQSMGISEHFEYLFETPRASPTSDKDHNWSDYLYMPDVSNQRHGIVDGMWGLLRAYKTPRKDLPLLSTNQNVKPLPSSSKAADYSCPPSAPVRQFTVNAESPSTAIVYNNRGVDDGAGKFADTTPITNPIPLMYTFQSTTPPGGSSTNVAPNVNEPLVLRANAGDCIALTLKNTFNTSAPVFSDESFAAFAQSTPLSPSQNAGITPGLLSYDVMTSSGMNIGFNPSTTVAPGGTYTYYWYAGDTKIDTSGNIKGTPIEFGGANLMPPDPMEQDNHGLIGGLVVEPPKTVACYDDNWKNADGTSYPTYTSAWIYEGTSCYSPGPLHHREFALLTQDDIAATSLTWPSACYCAVKGTGPSTGPCTPCMTTVENAIASPGTQTAINYRTEPMSYRFNAKSFNTLNTLWRAFSDLFVLGEPQTPILAAAANSPTRIHLLHPGGSGDQQVLQLHGHVWQELPYVDASTRIGDNKVSQYLGARDNYGANTSYSIILDKNGGAGGRDGILGDYLYRTHPADFITQGIWGLMRVGKPGSDIVSIAGAQFSSGGTYVTGSSSVFVDNKSNPKNGQRASTVALSYRLIGDSGDGTSLGNVNVGAGGLWVYSAKPVIPNPGKSEIVAVSTLGGRAVVPICVTDAPGDTPGTNCVTSEVAGPTLQAKGEAIRFINGPRDRKGVTTPPLAKPQEGLRGPETGKNAPKNVPEPAENAPPPPDKPTQQKPE